MDYESLSDFEVNKAVAEALGVLKYDVDLVGCGDSIQLFHFDKSVFIDYCNNPSDAWPVIVGNRIAIIPIEIIGTVQYRYMASADSYFGTMCNGALTFHCKNDSLDDNPLRAAMIVFLKMSENNNAN